jgi:hypothetical protein
MFASGVTDRATQSAWILAPACPDGLARAVPLRRSRMNARAMALLMSAAVVSLGVSQGAAAQAVQWSGNGHWYQVLPMGGQSSRNVAVEMAAARGGALVSLGSVEENAFVTSLTTGLDSSNRVWMGLSQDPQAANAGDGWSWDDGTPFVYTNWYPGQPDNAGSERKAHFFAATNEAAGKWNNIDDAGSGGVTYFAAVEWSADCNNDGIVDYGQCRDGSLPDYNGNNVPDCCEQGSPCVVGSYPVEWRVSDGGNGHWYQRRTFATANVSFGNALALAEAAGGTLATPLSAGENLFIRDINRFQYRSYWLGGVQVNPECGGVGCEWRWITDEVWDYTNWCCDGYDNDVGGTEDCLASSQDGFWNSVPCVGGLGMEHFMVEWSADCNADGLVDYGQILLGEFEDANANGVPDICEAYEVPAEFSTIQAAIDAVPAGEYGLVAVAAGVYNESFSLNGKNVLVRGAAGGATILDGAGIATSIARFTGGEPATAGLESLVFRNATSGSVPHKGAAYRVGGAVYGFGSSARIRDCRFEDNRSDFGGAMYLILSTLDVSGCEFVSNEGVAEGGGVLVYQCTGVVSGCEFLGNSCGLAGPGSGSGFKAVGALGVGEEVVLSGCTFTGNTANLSGSAVEFYENLESTSGRIRLVDTVIAGNASGLGTPSGAAGLRVIGTLGCATIGADVEICGNSPRNISGPYLVAGAFVSCDCEADITGDLNHDGLVTGADLTLVLGSWGGCQ